MIHPICNFSVFLLLALPHFFFCFFFLSEMSFNESRCWTAFYDCCWSDSLELRITQYWICQVAMMVQKKSFSSIKHERRWTKNVSRYSGGPGFGTNKSTGGCFTPPNCLLIYSHARALKSRKTHFTRQQSSSLWTRKLFLSSSNITRSGEGFSSVTSRGSFG